MWDDPPKTRPGNLGLCSNPAVVAPNSGHVGTGPALGLRPSVAVEVGIPRTAVGHSSQQSCLVELVREGLYADACRLLGQRVKKICSTRKRAGHAAQGDGYGVARRGRKQGSDHGSRTHPHPESGARPQYEIFSLSACVGVHPALCDRIFLPTNVGSIRICRPRAGLHRERSIPCTTG